MYVLRNNELNSIKEKQLEMADSMSYADQQKKRRLHPTLFLVSTNIERSISNLKPFFWNSTF